MLPDPELGRTSRRAGRARHHLGRALCHRAGARRRVAGAHQLLAALRRGGPLPAARPQHDRRDHAGTAATARCCSSRRPPKRCSARSVSELHGHRPVRPRACRRPAGLSHGAGGCGGARRGALGRVPGPARAERSGRSRDAAVHLGRDALPSARQRGRREPRRCREVVAVMRDVTERKTQEQALEEARARGRTRQRRQEPSSSPT